MKKAHPEAITIAAQTTNVLVTGVSGDKYALGYFGYAYYIENEEKLKVVGIANGNDISNAVKPSEKTIEDGSYAPLSRPLFLYVNVASLKRPEVVQFLRFYLEGGQDYVKRAKYVPLRKETVRRVEERARRRHQKSRRQVVPDIVTIRRTRRPTVMARRLDSFTR